MGYIGAESIIYAVRELQLQRSLWNSVLCKKKACPLNSADIHVPSTTYKYCSKHYEICRDKYTITLVPQEHSSKESVRQGWLSWRLQSWHIPFYLYFIVLMLPIKQLNALSCYPLLRGKKMSYDLMFSFWHYNIVIQNLAHCKHPIRVIIVTLWPIGTHHALPLLLGH